MLNIYRRELQAFFYTSVGYVFMGVFLVLSGILFYVTNVMAASSDTLMLLGNFAYLWIPLMPVLTMRLLAEERQKKTDQLLHTSPVTPMAIVLGKFMAAATVMMGTVLLTLFYMLVIATYGRVYPGELFAGYVGLIFQGLAFLALNLFISGCVKSQISAAIFSLGANFALWTVYALAQSMSNSALAQVLAFISLYNRYTLFTLGQFSFGSIAYYACFVALFLAAAVAMMHGRRWKEG